MPEKQYKKKKKDYFELSQRKVNESTRWKNCSRKTAQPKLKVQPNSKITYVKPKNDKENHLEVDIRYRNMK